MLGFNNSESRNQTEEILPVCEDIRAYKVPVLSAPSLLLLFKLYEEEEEEEDSERRKRASKKNLGRKERSMIGCVCAVLSSSIQGKSQGIMSILDDYAPQYLYPIPMFSARGVCSVPSCREVEIKSVEVKVVDKHVANLTSVHETWKFTSSHKPIFAFLLTITTIFPLTLTLL